MGSDPKADSKDTTIRINRLYCAQRYEIMGRGDAAEVSKQRERALGSRVRKAVNWRYD